MTLYKQQQKNDDQWGIDYDRWSTDYEQRRGILRPGVCHWCRTDQPKDWVEVVPVFVPMGREFIYYTFCSHECLENWGDWTADQDEIE